MTNTVLREPSELVEQLRKDVMTIVKASVRLTYEPSLGDDLAKVKVRVQQAADLIERLTATPSEEEVEAVARVVCVEDTVGLALHEVTPTEREHYFSVAHAAIAAMSPTPEPNRLREALVEARAALDSSQREIFELFGYSENEIDAAMAVFVTANKGFSAIDSALSASPAEPQEVTEAIPNWKLVHAVRSGALNALRHAGVSEELFAVVASATYAPIRTALRSAASGGDTV